MMNQNCRMMALVTGMISALALFTLSCSGGGDSAEPEVLRPVKTMEVAPAGGEMERSFSGMTKSGTVYRLSFRVGGKLSRMDVKNGDYVKQKQLIAELDDSDANLNYQKSLASLNRSEVFKNTAHSNLERIKGLYENDTVSLNEYEAAKDNSANAHATWLSEKRNVELQKKELGYYKLYAPDNGVISGKDVETGENLTAGQVVAEVIDTETIEVTSGVPETIISRVRPKDKTSIQFNAIPGKVFLGEVTEVAFSVDRDSSTYPVTLRVLEPSSAIRPGMPAMVTFTFQADHTQKGFLVPVNAVAEDSSGHFVYVMTPQEERMGIVSKRKVTLGRMTDRGFEILQGVQPGEKVVTAGISKLTDGLKVLTQ